MFLPYFLPNLALELESNNLAATGRYKRAPLPGFRPLERQHIPARGVETDGEAQKVMALLMADPGHGEICELHLGWMGRSSKIWRVVEIFQCHL